MSNFVLQPWQLLVTILAGVMNQGQQRVIDYLRTENHVLREKLGKNRILLNDDQRRRLAVKGRVLGRKALASIATIVTPDSILRWHHKLIACKWDYNERRKTSGRAPRYKDVPADLVQTYGHLYNDGYLIPSLDLVVVRLGRGEKFLPAFQSDLVKKVLAGVE